MKTKDAFNEFSEGDSDEFLKEQRVELLGEQIKQAQVLLELLVEKNKQIEESLAYIASSRKSNNHAGHSVWLHDIEELAAAQKFLDGPWFNRKK